MKHYDSFDNINIDKSLIGEEVWGFNKLDGQNFCAKYSSKNHDFVMFGSKTQNVDETSDQFGEAVKYFKHNISENLKKIIISNNKKGDIFNNVKEITFFFEWYGENSFAGVHVPGETLKLALIDVNIYKKGYIEPKIYWKIFNGKIDIPELIYRGILTKEIISLIQNNIWNEDNCLYPSVKEGVVFKRSTQLKGQRLPKVKVKTFWWLNKLKSLYPTNWEELE